MAEKQEKSSPARVRQRIDGASDAPDLTAKRGAAKIEKNPSDAPDEATKTPIYRRPLFVIGAAAVLLIAAFVGLRYYLHARAHETTDNAFIEADAVQVSPRLNGTVRKVYVTDNQQVKTGDLLAELDARDYETRLAQSRASLQAAVARRRQASANTDLTAVTAYAQVDQAASGVETARAQRDATARAATARRSVIDQQRAGVRAAEANLEQTLAELRAAEANAERDEKDALRYKELYEKDAVSRQRYDQAVAAAKTSVAQADAVRKRADSARAQMNQTEAAVRQAEDDFRQATEQINVAESQIGEARGRLRDANAAPQRIAVSDAQTETGDAEIEQARAAVEEAELQLSYTKIYAPETGRVTRKAIDEGQLVSSGQQLMAIVHGAVWVTANFKETQLEKMRVGQPVEIEVDAYPDKVFRGRIESFQSGTGAQFSLLPAENATGNYVKVVQRIPVKIVFEEQPNLHLLAPGMSVAPEVDISEKSGAENNNSNQNNGAPNGQTAENQNSPTPALNQSPNNQPNGDANGK